MSGSKSTTSRRRKEPSDAPPAHLISSDPVDFNKYTLFLRTTRSHIVKSWIEGLRYLLQEGSLVFDRTEDGPDTGCMTLASTNSTESVFVYSKIYSHLFETWYCEKRTVISLNFGQLHRAIRSCSEKDLFTMFCERDVHDRLFIKIQNSLELETVYSIQLLELVPPSLSIPRLSYPICVTVNSQMLSRCLRDMEHVSALYIKFVATGNTLTLSSLNTPSDEIGHVRQESVFKSTTPSASAAPTNLPEGDGSDVFVQQDENSSMAAPKCYSGVFLLKVISKCAPTKIIAL